MYFFILTYNSKVDFSGCCSGALLKVDLLPFWEVVRNSRLCHRIVEFCKASSRDFTITLSTPATIASVLVTCLNLDGKVAGKRMHVILSSHHTDNNATLTYFIRNGTYLLFSYPDIKKNITHKYTHAHARTHTHYTLCNIGY